MGGLEGANQSWMKHVPVRIVWSINFAGIQGNICLTANEFQSVCDAWQTDLQWAGYACDEALESLVRLLAANG
jgi:hypothetical protein